MFEEKENFISYRDDVVRCVVECIRVLDDKKISIILKDGYTVEERIIAWNWRTSPRPPRFFTLTKKLQVGSESYVGVEVLLRDKRKLQRIFKRKDTA